VALKDVQSRADVAAAMWNHVPLMLQAARQRGIDLPRLSPREMADLFAYLMGSASTATAPAGQRR
jgi:hypothetical protein